MTRWEDESNESMYKTSDMEPRANGVVWCSGMGKIKYVEVIWSYGEKKE